MQVQRFTGRSLNAFDDTAYQGEISCSYGDLVAAFGEPHEVHNGKLRVEWRLRVGGYVATVYDWGQLNTALADVQRWHVGGHTARVVAEIQAAVR